MDDPSEARAPYPKTASCACGALTISVTASPVKIHACTCLDCQRRSGSAFTYTAFFVESAVSIAGTFRPYRRVATSGRWNDSHFCPECGISVFTRMEALPDMVGVPVGCFADPQFEKPGTVYWTSRRHRWFAPPPGFETVDTQ